MVLCLILVTLVVLMNKWFHFLLYVYSAKTMGRGYECCFVKLFGDSWWYLNACFMRIRVHLKAMSLSLKNHALVHGYVFNHVMVMKGIHLFHVYDNFMLLVWSLRCHIFMFEAYFLMSLNYGTKNPNFLMYLNLAMTTLMHEVFLFIIMMIC